MREDLEAALNNLSAGTIGRRLKDARLQAGLTQPQVAGQDASAAYLSRIERGERRPGHHLLEKFCSRLGVDPEVLIAGAPVPDVRAAECDVDLAELALLTGTAADAYERTERLLNSDLVVNTPPLAERAQLVRGSAQAALGDSVGAITTFEGLVSEAATRRVLTQASLRLCRLLRETGDITRSIEVGEAALRALTTNESAPPDDLINVSVTLAAAYWENGDEARALTICRQAIAASEAAGSASARAAAYWNTAIIESEAGRLDEALELTRRALSLFESDSDLRLQARLRTQLAELLLRTDPPQTDEALHLLLEARQTLEFTAADMPELLHTRLALVRARLSAGDPEAAAAEAAECLREGEDLPFVAATAAILLGRIAAGRDIDSARRSYLQAIHHLTAVGADRRAAQLWFNLAADLDEVGLADEAKDAYRRAAVSTGLAVASRSSAAVTG